ncbi:transporter, major facilitator family protein [Besnoitia besnoiti]|uniref:Molybdate-anion transporter n=1 Tax=Besnoitia besnoiti TaxID=94643 RepID=A0A2A9MKR6_BESBE|nr:transporter, major facilitator family protein [Besnoitia besnoiti]PFH36217.1 transporter, major facilitator family protein [Besnoitia besnoiti]
MTDPTSCMRLFALPASLVAGLVSWLLCFASSANALTVLPPCESPPSGAPARPSGLSSAPSLLPTATPPARSSSSRARIVCAPPEGLADARAAYLRLRRSYVIVYLLSQASEWIQGPYMYAFYASACALPLHRVGLLFLTEYASAGVFGCLAGCLTDLLGRRRACVAYCLLCILSSSLTRCFPSCFASLLLGRLVGGVALSLLETAFEAWMVAAHRHFRFPDAWLEETLGTCAFFNGILAILVGLFTSLVSNFLGAAASFDFAALFALLCAASVVKLLPSVPEGGDREGEESPRKPAARTRRRSDCVGRSEIESGRPEVSEGYRETEERSSTEPRERLQEPNPSWTGDAAQGDGGGGGRRQERTGEETREIRANGEVKAAFRGERDEREIRQRSPHDSGEEASQGPAMQVVHSRPRVRHRGRQERHLLPEEAGAQETFSGERRFSRSRPPAAVWRLLCKHLKTALGQLAQSRPAQACGAIQIFFEVPMYIFFVTWTPALGPNIDHGLVFACFMACVVLGSEIFLHVVCGVYYPGIATVRAKVLPDDTRATLVNLFRLPLNAAIIVLGGWGMTEVNFGPLFASSAALTAVSALLCVYLAQMEEEHDQKELHPSAVRTRQEFHAVLV